MVTSWYFSLKKRTYFLMSIYIIKSGLCLSFRLSGRSIITIFRLSGRFIITIFRLSGRSILIFPFVRLFYTDISVCPAVLYKYFRLFVGSIILCKGHLRRPMYEWQKKTQYETTMKFSYRIWCIWIRASYKQWVLYT